jgi:hypothetical protein
VRRITLSKFHIINGPDQLRSFHFKQLHFLRVINDIGEGTARAYFFQLYAPESGVAGSNGAAKSAYRNVNSFVCGVNFLR